MGTHHILGQEIAVKKALEREQKEMIAAGGSVRGGRGIVCSGFSNISTNSSNSSNTRTKTSVINQSGFY